MLANRAHRVLSILSFSAAYPLIYDSFVCCLSLSSEVTDLDPQPESIEALSFSTFYSLHGVLIIHLGVTCEVLFLGSGSLASNWELTCDLITVGSCDSKLATGANFNLLIFSGVKNLQDILAEVVAGTGFHRSALKQHLDVSQLGEVEISFLVESVVLESELLDGTFELLDLGVACSTTHGGTTTDAGSCGSASVASSDSRGRSSRGA